MKQIFVQEGANNKLKGKDVSKISKKLMTSNHKEGHVGEVAKNIFFKVIRKGFIIF